ncbi:hypothetical protein B0H19DRAFT_1186390 [Mycena capillaripes]|nr:hypothetical protein B0H19DRAFT_1186390 [Mycena capillaripes]
MFDWAINKFLTLLGGLSSWISSFRSMSQSIIVHPRSIIPCTVAVQHSLLPIVSPILPIICRTHYLIIPSQNHPTSRLASPSALPAHHSF